MGIRSTGRVISDEGTVLPIRPRLNFTGASVTASDNAAANRTDISVSAGGGGGGSTAGMLLASAYGAVGNGSTNDTTALQNWLNAGNTTWGGNTCLLDAVGANAYMSDPLTITRGGVNLRVQGAGQNTQIKARTNTTTPLLTVNNTGYTGLDFWMESINLTGPYTTGVGMQINGVWFPTLNNCLINGWDTALQIGPTGSGLARFLNSYFASNGPVAVSIGAGGLGSPYNNAIHFDKCWFRATQYGLKFQNGCGLTVRHCDFEGGDGGIYIGNYGGQYAPNVIDACWFENNSGSSYPSIYIAAGSAPTIIRNCQLDNGTSGAPQVYIESGAGPVVIDCCWGSDASSQIFVGGNTSRLHVTNSRVNGYTSGDVSNNF